MHQVIKKMSFINSMYIIYMHALGYTTYKLPLALEPITNISNAHGIYMLIELPLKVS